MPREIYNHHTNKVNIGYLPTQPQFQIYKNMSPECRYCDSRW